MPRKRICTRHMKAALELEGMVVPVTLTLLRPPRPACARAESSLRLASFALQNPRPETYACSCARDRAGPGEPHRGLARGGRGGRQARGLERLGVHRRPVVAGLHFVDCSPRSTASPPRRGARQPRRRRQPPPGTTPTVCWNASARWARRPAAAHTGTGARRRGLHFRRISAIFDLSVRPGGGQLLGRGVGPGRRGLP